MRILTYNIHGGLGSDGRRDYGRIAAFFRELEPQVVFLQEFESRVGHGGKGVDLNQLFGNDYPYCLPGPTMFDEDGGWYGNAILSKFPFRKRSRIDLSVPAREPRNLLDVQIETDTGPLRLLNTHKGLNRRERRFQFARIFDCLTQQPEVPLVLGGDFNEWRGWFSLIRVLNRILSPHPCGPTWPSRFPLFHLDRVWSRPHRLIRSVHALRTRKTKRFSDHLPVLVELQWPFRAGL